MDELYSSRRGKKCVIYIRVSSERQVQGYSLEGQKRFLKEWAEFEGMTVEDVYIEPGKSGKSVSGREVFQKMLTDIESGEKVIDYVVAVSYTHLNSPMFIWLEWRTAYSRAT